LLVLTNILPLTIGVQNLRLSIDNGTDFFVWMSNPYFYLQIIYSFSALLCGLAIFRYAVKAAKDKGIIKLV